MAFGVVVWSRVLAALFFFFNATATTEIYTLSLHDALPISTGPCADLHPRRSARRGNATSGGFVPAPVSCSDKGQSASASLRHTGPSLPRRRCPDADGGFHRLSDLRLRAGENAREYLRVRGSVSGLQLPRGCKNSSIPDCKSG